MAKRERTLAELRYDIAAIKGQLGNDNGMTYFFERNRGTTYTEYRRWLQKLLFAKHMLEMELTERLNPMVVRSNTGEMGAIVGGRFYSRSELVGLIEEIDRQTFSPDERAEHIEALRAAHINRPNVSRDIPDDIPEESEPQPWEDAYYERWED